MVSELRTWRNKKVYVGTPVVFWNQEGNTDTSATLVWRTDVASAADSRVRYGLADAVLDQAALGAGAVPASNAAARDHVVTLSDLTPATTYFYDVGTVTDGQQGGGTPNHVFRTAPVPGVATPFTAWIVGDSGVNNAVQHGVRDAMLAHTGDSPPDIALHMGDMAYNDGTDLEYTQKHFAVYADILRRTPFWPSMGNHDELHSHSGAQTGPYYEAFVLPTQGEAGGAPSGTEAYYAFDYANVHFVVLDTADTSLAVGAPQLLWLEADLASTEQDWIVAFFHHPPYTKANHDSDNPANSGGRLRATRENVVPILEAGGVDLVLAGHSHKYERSYLIDSAHGYGDATPALPVLMADGRIVDAGDGNPAGDGAYNKLLGPDGNQGAVFIVAGHGGRNTAGATNHPVMAFSELANGSAILSVDGLLLTVRNIRSDGVVSDTFLIRKSPVRCDDDAECAGGDACTIDRCQGNVCVHRQVQCEAGSACDPESGECVPLPVVATLQDGLDDYAGTLDTFIAEGAPDTVFGAAEAAGWDSQDSDTNNLPTLPLLRFAIFARDGGPIPDTAQLSRVTLRLTNFNAGDPGAVFEVLADWDEATAFNGFGDVAGLQPEDQGAGRGAIAGPLGPTTVDVTASVRAWQANPGTNRGWIIVPDSTSGVEFRTREFATAAERPALVVSYLPDGDGDGVVDPLDNCPADANPEQADRDEDGAGDPCDACPDDPADDVDGDQVCGDVDNCPADANRDQADGDEDGAGDVCDACPADPDDDADADGVCGDIDNCPALPNRPQTDSDGDDAGDVCDPWPFDAEDDGDGDDHCGDVDNCPADTNADQADGDDDGIGDVCDPCDADADNDVDGDGRCGDVDNCPADANPEQTDSDDDGAGDACDRCPLDADDDADADEVCGDVDNCPADANADQADEDEDGVGDVCDNCPDGDIDRDGVCDVDDVCPEDADPEQLDGDDDGRGDVCDRCPADPADDADDDGVCGDVDRCPAIADPEQADTDDDGAGDACDDDDDGDGLLDDADNCPLHPNPEQANLDQDALGDACDGDVDGDGVADDRERELGLNPRRRDSDRDTIVDLEELGSPLEPRDSDGDETIDALDTDSDDDGIDDRVEAGDDVPETPAVDTDDDGLPDYRDPDSDADTVADDVDNCRVLANLDQADADGDAVGDVCDDTPLPADAGAADALPPDAAVPDAAPEGDAALEADAAPEADGALEADAAADGKLDASGVDGAVDPTPDALVPPEADGSGSDSGPGASPEDEAAADDGGCGCQAPGGSGPGGLWLWILLVARVRRR